MGRQEPRPEPDEDRADDVRPGVSMASTARIDRAGRVLHATGLFRTACVSHLSPRPLDDPGWAIVSVAGETWPCRLSVRPGGERVLECLGTRLDTFRSEATLAMLMAALWGLTPAESRTVLALCRGLPVAGIAAERGVSRETVRTQLRQARQKTRTGSVRALALEVWRVLASPR